MTTKKPRRIWLSIKDSTTNALVNKRIVVRIEPQHLSLQDSVSELYQVSMIKDIRIFIAKFKNTIRCSDADLSHFVGTHLDEGTYNITNMQEEIRPFSDNLDERGLGWHFFSLGDPLATATNSLASLDAFVPESERIQSLRTSLSKGIKIGEKILKCSVYDLNDQQHYCQFSGGGDIFFNMHEEVAVVCTNPITLDEIDGSPTAHADNILTGSLFEGKKIEAESIDSLKYQLMANMIILCMKVLVDKLTLKTMDLKATTISCYGIACTGAGTFGFMKLAINFDNQTMSFQSKIPFQTCAHRTTSAAFIDYSIAYIAKKMVT